MDAATLQNRIYKGYAKAATRIGYNTDIHRPKSASNPMASVNKLRAIPVSFNVEDMKYSKPNKYAHPTWYGVYDGTQTQVGDYLTNPQDGTFYVAAQQQALPILLVECNRTINILRPQQETGIGAQGYGGDTDANETALMTAWPASVLQGSKGDKIEMALPGDTRSPAWAILMPYYTGIILRSADIITDDLARRYVISSAELTDLGWRIQAMQVQT